MQQYSLELSQSLDPSFGFGGQGQSNNNKISIFELSLLCGIMVHPASTFSTDDEGTALSIEWEQKYPV
jgi:hypothetical protein